MRNILKVILNTICLLIVSPLSLSVRFISAERSPSVLFTLSCHIFSLLPGVIGVYLRRGFYRVALPSCGSDVSIGFGTILALRGTHIGRDCYIGTNCTIGLANIGESVLIGSNVDLIGSPQLHNVSRIDVPIKKQDGDTRVVDVGDASWIGNSAVILANVGQECVVGAGSVVSKDCEDWGIYVGNPARRIRDRRESQTEKPDE